LANIVDPEALSFIAQKIDAEINLFMIASKYVSAQGYFVTPPGETTTTNATETEDTEMADNETENETTENETSLETYVPPIKRVITNEDDLKLTQTLGKMLCATLLQMLQIMRPIESIKAEHFEFEKLNDTAFTVSDGDVCVKSAFMQWLSICQQYTAKTTIPATNTRKTPANDLVNDQQMPDRSDQASHSTNRDSINGFPTNLSTNNTVPTNHVTQDIANLSLNNNTRTQTGNSNRLADLKARIDADQRRFPDSETAAKLNECLSAMALISQHYQECLNKRLDAQGWVHSEYKKLDEDIMRLTGKHFEDSSALSHYHKRIRNGPRTNTNHGNNSQPSANNGGNATVTIHKHTHGNDDFKLSLNDLGNTVRQSENALSKTLQSMRDLVNADASMTNTFKQSTHAEILAKIQTGM